MRVNLRSKSSEIYPTLGENDKVKAMMMLLGFHLEKSGRYGILIEEDRLQKIFCMRILGISGVSHFSKDGTARHQGRGLCQERWHSWVWCFWLRFAALMKHQINGRCGEKMIGCLGFSRVAPH